MIRFDDVTITYPDQPQPTVRAVNLDIAEGELCLLVGATGTGKSTLLGAVNGLVPHFTGGTLQGRVTVDGRDTRLHHPRNLSDLVGWVGQDPAAGFVADIVEDELAYGMEQLAVPAATMRKRVEETLDLLGLADLRHRPLADISGGEQQRVAIGAVLTSHPRVLVLDEPTSALDPTAAEEVLAAITRLVHDLGVTVLLAEHRLERVAQYADRVAHIDGDGNVTSGDPASVLTASPVAPPVVDLARLAGWAPAPLSVRDARRLMPELTSRLATVPERHPPIRHEIAVAVRHLTVVHGATVAVADVDLTFHRGEITALMGRNGAGKSSLLWAIHGAGKRSGGRVTFEVGTDVDRPVGLVPQTPGDLLYLETVDGECAQADIEAGVSPGTCRTLLDTIVPGVPGDHHPRDLSEGQRLGLVLAIQLTGAPPVVLLDEPTRGLDYAAKRRLGVVIADLASGGKTVVVSTHDVEFAASVAERVVVMSQGELVADGAASDVLTSSPAFAPQVTKIVGPDWLTVDEVRAALQPVAP